MLEGDVALFDEGEGDGADGAQNSQNQKLERKRQIVAVEEGRRRRYGLTELEESKGGGAFLLVHVTQDGITLSVEAGVSQTEQRPDADSQIFVRKPIRFELGGVDGRIGGKGHEDEEKGDQMDDHPEEDDFVPTDAGSDFLAQKSKDGASDNFPDAGEDADEADEALSFGAERQRVPDRSRVHAAPKRQLQTRVKEADAQQDHVEGLEYVPRLPHRLHRLLPVRATSVRLNRSVAGFRQNSLT